MHTALALAHWFITKLVDLMLSPFACVYMCMNKRMKGKWNIIHVLSVCMLKNDAVCTSVFVLGRNDKATEAQRKEKKVVTVTSSAQKKENLLLPLSSEPLRNLFLLQSQSSMHGQSVADKRKRKLLHTHEYMQTLAFRAFQASLRSPPSIHIDPLTITALPYLLNSNVSIYSSLPCLELGQR